MTANKVLCISLIKKMSQRKTFFNFNVVTKHSFPIELIIGRGT